MAVAPPGRATRSSAAATWVCQPPLTASGSGRQTDPILMVVTVSIDAGVEAIQHLITVHGFMDTTE